MPQTSDTRRSLMSHLSRGLLYSAPLMIVAAAGAGHAVAADADSAELAAGDYEVAEETILAEGEGEGEGEEGEGEGEGEA